MSGAVSVPGSGGGGQSQDFELNLAPIIDCFTVLVTFMLVSSAFISISFMDAGAASAGNSQSTAAPPPVEVTVELKANKDILVVTSGKHSRKENLPAKAGEWDFSGMAQEVAKIKGTWSGVESIVLTAEDSVEYKDIVRAMEAGRKNVGLVLLGGF